MLAIQLLNRNKQTNEIYIYINSTTINRKRDSILPIIANRLKLYYERELIKSREKQRERETIIIYSLRDQLLINLTMESNIA